MGKMLLKIVGTIAVIAVCFTGAIYSADVVKRDALFDGELAVNHEGDRYGFEQRKREVDQGLDKLNTGWGKREVDQGGQNRLELGQGKREVDQNWDQLGSGWGRR